MEPWQNWAIVCVAGAGAYLYYSRSNTGKRGRRRTSVVQELGSKRDSKTPVDIKDQRRRGDTVGARDQANSDIAEISPSSTLSKGKGRAKKRKGLRDNSGVQDSVARADHSPELEDNSGNADNDGMDNMEFAKQLSSLKTGTSVTKPPNTNDSGKTKKVGKRGEAVTVPSDGHSGLNGVRNSKDISNASSTTGADGDDDLSPTHSPLLRATLGTKVSGDVSDMLEAKPKGPSVLRLTEPSEPQVVRQAKPQKSVQEQETKKQRQHRKKNEEKKLAREEAEKERRIALEKQLRTAREAEGRPSKNGLSPSKPPTTSVWTKPNGEAVSSSSSVAEINSTLLDTFDENTSSAVKTIPQEHGGNSVAASSKVWEREMPSEEEQMRLLNEMDGNDGWSTVKKATKSKKKMNVDKENETSFVDNGKSTMVSNVANDTNPNGTYDASTSTNSMTSDSGLDPAQGRNNSQPRRANPSSSTHKVVHEKADPSIWNRDNIHEHPQYDSRYPWALIGHPDDSDWAVI